MIKKLFYLSCLLTYSLSTYADGWINLNWGYNNPNNTLGSHRSPVRIPTVLLEGYTICFSAFEEDCTILFWDENGVVISMLIPAGTTSIEMPNTFSGKYTIQLIISNWIYVGEIELLKE